MPTRDEMIQALQEHDKVNSQAPSREEMIKALTEHDSSLKEKPKEESFGRQLTRSAIDTVLPVGGAILAGAAATPESLGLATIPAGAAGYAAGKQAARVLNHYLLDDNVGPTDAVGLVKQTAGDLGEGALMETGGVLLGKGLEAAAPAAKKLGGKIGEYAEKTAAKVVGAGPTEFRDTKNVKAIGRNALDNIIKNPFSSAEENLLRAKDAKKAAGNAMDEVYGAVDKEVGPQVSPLETATRVDKELSPTYRTPINKSEVNQLENTLESILARGDKNVTLKELQDIKTEIDSVGYPKGKKPLDPTPKQQMAQDASRIVRDEIDKAAQAGADKVGNQDLIKKLSEARASYGVNKQTVKLLTTQVGKEGAEVGTKINWTVDPVKFGASIVKRYGPNVNAMKAMSADTISKVLQKEPQFAKLAKESPEAYKAILNSIVLEVKPANVIESTLPKTADDPGKEINQVPLKGPEKWVDDGAKKLQEHTAGKLPDGALNELKNTKKGRELLMQASDLKPGSKAIASIYLKIKNMKAGV